MRSTILAAKRARSLRREMSEPEVMLWSRLRKRAGNGLAFRRQHPIGHYVLDFYCNAVGSPWRSTERITRRTRRLVTTNVATLGSRSQGLTVMRIPASHIMRDVDEAADGVLLMASSLMARR